MFNAYNSMFCLFYAQELLMEKKRRRRQGEPGIHTAVVLPREMLDQLRESGRERGRGVSEEIRNRLGGSLLDDKLDQTTRLFTGEILELAGWVRRHVGTEWYADVYAHEVFSHAVAARLARHKPTATSAAAASGTTTPPDDPAVVGRVIERAYHRDREEKKAEEAVITRQRMEKNK
jgi:Arc-like DNA binding domain